MINRLGMIAGVMPRPVWASVVAVLALGLGLVLVSVVQASAGSLTFVEVVKDD